MFTPKSLPLSMALALRWPRASARQEKFIRNGTNHENASSPLSTLASSETNGHRDSHDHCDSPANHPVSSSVNDLFRSYQPTFFHGEGGCFFDAWEALARQHNQTGLYRTTTKLYLRYESSSFPVTRKDGGWLHAVQGQDK